MKVQATRAFWMGEKVVNVGDVVDVKPALAAELISYGKAVAAPETTEKRPAKAAASVIDG